MGLLGRLGFAGRDDGVSSAEVGAWFEGKEFTTDWFSKNAQTWMRLLAPVRDKPLDILEVGCFEGRSSLFFLNYFPACRLTAVDNFCDGKNEKWKGVERRFDQNIATFGDRVTVIKLEAATALSRLATQKKAFDIVYLDAGKQREWVFALSSLAWPLARVGGHVIWDDLDWKPHLDSAQRPNDAIRLFSSTFGNCLAIKARGSQLIAQKTAEWPKGYITKAKPRKVKARPAGAAAK